MKRMARYFLEGLLFVVPLAITVYVLVQVFVTVDGWFRDLLGLPVPGAGFVLTLAFITAVGFLASNVLTRGVLSLVDALFARLPFVKLLYTSIKDLIGAFVGEKKSFDRPVLVSLTPDGSVKAIGFVTRDDLETFGLRESVAVYFPQSYNFAGNLLVFPRDRVQPVPADSADVMTFLVSGGVSGK